MRISISSDQNTEAGKKVAALLPFFLYAFAAVFLLVAAGLLLLGRSAAADARLLAAEGVPVAATVTDRTITETRSRDSNDRLRTTTSYRITLTFATAAGETVTVDHPVSKARFDGLADGQITEVFYAPSRPTLVSFERGDAEAGVGFFGVMAAIFGLVGLGIGWLGLTLRRRMAAAA